MYSANGTSIAMQNNAASCDQPLLKRARITTPFDVAWVESIKLACGSGGERAKVLKTVGDAPADELATFIASGGIEVVGGWLHAALETQETGLVHACLGCLEKLPMNMEVLQRTKIGKVVNESLKACHNQVAVERARKLINGWKSAVAAPKPPKAVSEKRKRIDRTKNGEEEVTGDLVMEEVALPVAEEAVIPAESPLSSESSGDRNDDQPVEGNVSPFDDPTGVSALASMLDSIPDLDDLAGAVEALEELANGKRRIRWKSDTDLVQMVEFGITDTCVELRRTIDDTHGGFSTLHPHGTDTAEELNRFKESRKRERAKGGERLRASSSSMGFEDDDIEATISVFTIAPRVKVQFAAAKHDIKKSKSYERQDLADIHGPKPEVVYANGVGIPDSPGEPSSAVYKLQSNVTVDVHPSGMEEVQIIVPPTAVVAPVAPVAGDASPEQAEPLPQGPVRNVLRAVSFDDEFVKLNSRLQTVIMESEALLRIFMEEPALLREMTMEKIQSLLTQLTQSSNTVHPNPNRNHPQQPRNPPRPGPVHAHTECPKPAPFIEDRKSWGVSTIRSSVRNEVMNSFSTAQHPQRGTDPYFRAPLHQGPPPTFQGGHRSPDEYGAPRAPYMHGPPHPGMHAHGEFVPPMMARPLGYPPHVHPPRDAPMNHPLPGGPDQRFPRPSPNMGNFGEAPAPYPMPRGPPPVPGWNPNMHGGPPLPPPPAEYHRYPPKDQGYHRDPSRRY